MPVKEYLEIEETEKLEEAAVCVRDKLLIRLLRRLGCRVSEVLALGEDDIDFAAQTVTIEHLKARINFSCPECDARLGKTHTFCPKCGLKVEKAIAKELEHRRTRRIPIDSETLDMVRYYLDQGGGVTVNGKKFLFGIKRKRAWQIFLECARAAGLPDLVNPDSGIVHHVSPHKLRDAFAVNAVKIDDSGDGIRLLQEHLGHQGINTTMKYRKVAGEESRNWYDNLFKKKVNDNGT